MPYYDNYLGTGSFAGGHYRTAQRSGSIAATIGALGHLARIRFPATATGFCVVKKIRVGITVDTAITTATEWTLQAVIARGFTVDFTTAMTSISMTGKASTQQVRTKYMSQSQMGTAGPGIATTTVLSGQTLVADTAPIAVVTFPGLLATNSVGTAVAVPVGWGTAMTTLYDCNSAGEHPVVIAPNEGVIIQPLVAGPASGTFGLYVEWTWAEVQNI